RLSTISFILLIFPGWYISYATTFTDLLIGGLFVGAAGAIFSVGVTSLPNYYPLERHCFLNGIYVVGNARTAISTCAAAVLPHEFVWQRTVQFYIILLIAAALLNIVFGDKKESKVDVPLKQQIKSVYQDEKLWLLSLFYFITFGVFVAFTIYVPRFLVSHFELDKVDAGLRTAGFIVIATLLRPVGGWLGDRFNSFKILMY